MNNNEDDLKLELLNYQNGKLDMSLSGEQGKMFMVTLIQFFKDNGGENFLTLTINDKYNNKYAINIENCNGKFTSAEKLNILDNEIKEIKKYIQNKIKYFHRQNLHINDNDSHSDIRYKDMNYGKLCTYEDMLEKINQVEGENN